MTSSDTCVDGTGNVANAPLCGALTYGILGVCGKCQKNTDGSGGDGDGTTQGTCQVAGEVCSSTGSCTGIHDNYNYKKELNITKIKLINHLHIYRIIFANSL